MKVVVLIVVGVLLFAGGVALYWAGFDLRYRIGGKDGLEEGIGYAITGVILCLAGFAAAVWAVIVKLADRAKKGNDESRG